MDEDSTLDRLNHDEESADSILNRILSKSGFVLRRDRLAEPEPLREPEPIPEPVIEQKVFFKNVQFLKAGGMANLYLAVLNDPQSRWHDRKVVIKRIIPEKTNIEGYSQLFFKEYLLLRDLEHDNVISVIRQGEDETGQYYLTEYIQGKNLSELIESNIGLTKKDGKRKRLIDILSGILYGIHAIHEAGIIHRDIAPANIIITNSTNKVKILDFGLAKSDAIEDNLQEAGTPPYASPEQQYNAYKVDNRTDIYSFGIILLELITGSNNKAMCSSLINHFPGLVGIINKCTEEQPDQRYNYISEVLDDFSNSEVQNELLICREKTVIELNKESKSKNYTKPEKKKEKQEPVRKDRSSKTLIYGLVAGVVIVAALITIFNMRRPSIPGIKTITLEFNTRAGEVKILDINYSGNWDVESEIDWIGIEKITENKNQIIVKTLSDNLLSNERSGVLKIVDDNGDAISSIDVKQFGVAPYLSVTPNKIIFGYKINQPLKVDVNSNLSWVAETDADWIKIDPNNADKGQQISIYAKNPNLKDEMRESKVLIKAAGTEKTEIIQVAQNGQMLIEIDKPYVSFDPVVLNSEKIKVSSNTAWKFGEIQTFLKVYPVSGLAGNTEVNISVVNENTEVNKAILNLIALKTNSIVSSIAIDVTRPEIQSAERIVVKWSYEDLTNYINKIRDTSSPVDYNELFSSVDPKCKVYEYIQNKKGTSWDDIRTFVNNIRFGFNYKAVENTIIYNSEGKIIEFCQE